ncbi:MAG: cation:proton antiporter [Lachnospiraceae bacterium]|nr:cation:proton antiporter [Lachnospiraceae bacterium]
MLLSISLIVLCGMFLGYICKKIKLPSLVGMILTGILLGPYVFNLIDDSILNISADIRKIALIIILTRAGLSLDISGLKKIGRPAVLMCFLPASFELLGMLILGPLLLNLTLLEAAILGSVLAAVSPAVVVPRMIKLMEEGYGNGKSIPQLILAGASVDDVFVIVLFTTFTGIAQGGSASVMEFVNIPVSVAAGIAIGLIVGWILSKYFSVFHMRDTVKVLIILAVSFLLVVMESILQDKLKTPITFSALIAIMFIGIALRKHLRDVSDRLSSKFNKLWVGAEIFLFVLVGATVNISYLGGVGVKAIVVILGAVVFRMLGVFVCLIKTDLNMKERGFTMMAYTPKATVQAAIGGIPLSLGLACGDITLTVAVLAIIITAPVGAFAIDLSYKKLLRKEKWDA